MTETENSNAKNYLNSLCFIVNIVITYGVGTAGWGGAQSNAEISDKYQTIISPNGKAFIIWSIIFLTEAIFTLIQHLPKYRSTTLVQKGISYYFIGACLFQTAWTFPFGYEVMWLALIFIICLGICLCAIVISIYYIKEEEKKGILNWFLFSFPFEVHCGWIIVASILNANILYLQQGANGSMQLAAGIVSLGLLILISAFVLFFPAQPNFIIPLVAAWASGWIAVELKNPKSSITSTFDESTIQGMETAAAVICAVILIITVLRAVLFFLQKYFGISLFPRSGRVGEEDVDGGGLVAGGDTC